MEVPCGDGLASRSGPEACTPNGGLMLAVFQVPNKFFGDGGTTDVLGQDWDAAWGELAKVRATG